MKFIIILYNLYYNIIKFKQLKKSHINTMPETSLQSLISLLI